MSIKVVSEKNILSLKPNVTREDAQLISLGSCGHVIQTAHLAKNSFFSFLVFFADCMLCPILSVKTKPHYVRLILNSPISHLNLCWMKQLQYFFILASILFSWLILFLIFSHRTSWRPCQSRTLCEARDIFENPVFLPPSPNTGIIGVHHHVQCWNGTGPSLC